MKKGIRIISALLVIVLVWTIASLGRGVFTAKRSSTENLTITGHRGGALLGAENSLECIRKGLEAGVSSIEIDVHITADGHIVVCHSRNVNRTTNGSGAINEMTIEQIKELRLLENGVVTDQQVPTLEQVLELIDGRVELLLEIKRTNGNNKGIEQHVLEILRKHDALKYTVIQSFNDSVLETLHALDSTLRLEAALLQVPGYSCYLRWHIQLFLATEVQLHKFIQLLPQRALKVTLGILAQERIPHTHMDTQRPVCNPRHRTGRRDNRPPRPFYEQ